MRRIIRSIKNLFGADVRLRKWCLETAIRQGAPASFQMDLAADYYNYLTTGRPLLTVEYLKFPPREQ